MKAQSRLLIAGSTVSQLGNWVNVTAVMIILQQHHGAAMVAVYFLARTIAPYLLSRPLVGVMPGHLVGKAWASNQVALVLIMFALAFWNQNTSLLITLLAAAGVLQSATSSWLMHIAEATEPADRKALITAISTGTSVAIVAGPGLGGVLSTWGGLLPVFLFDSATFAASLFLVPWWRVPAPPADEIPKRSARETLLTSLLPIKPRIAGRVWPLVAAWIAFGLFGGLFTAIETPVFSLVKGFGPDQIGAAISAYGLGGLVVFLASTFFGFSNRYLSTSAIALAGVIGWTLGADWFLYAAFFVTGLGFALANSSARVAFGDVFAESKVASSEGWAWVNQLSLSTSVVSYFAAWMYFALNGRIEWIASTVLVLGGLCLAFGISWDAQAAKAHNRAAAQMQAQSVHSGRPNL